MVEKVYCICGCGQGVVYKPYFKYYGIAEFIHGHNGRGKKRFITESWKKNMSLAHKGCIHSEESNKKRSESMKKVVHTKEWNKKVSETKKRNPYRHSEEVLRRISKKLKGRKNGPCLEETKRRISKTQKEGYASGRIKVRFQTKMFNTSIELKMRNQLDKNNIKYKSNYFITGIGFVDIFLPDYDIIIECDGDYWHTLPGAQEKDSKRDFNATFLYGYRTIRFWEHEINKSSDKCMERVRKEITKALLKEVV